MDHAAIYSQIRDYYLLVSLQHGGKIHPLTYTDRAFISQYFPNIELETLYRRRLLARTLYSVRESITGGDEDSE